MFPSLAYVLESDNAGDDDDETPRKGDGDIPPLSAVELRSGEINLSMAQLTRFSLLSILWSK